MALTEIFRTDFDTDAKVAKFFYSPAPNGLANIVKPRRNVVDAISCIDINMGSEVPGTSYYGTKVSNVYVAGSAFSQMTADSQPNGTISYCYDVDSTKHGRYVWASGSPGARTGPATPPLLVDENHRRVAQIGLALQSWSASSDPAADGGSLGYPVQTNLTNIVMRWRMRAIEMSMPRTAKILQHFQTHVPRIPTLAGPFGRPYVNAFNIKTCISDALGFGTGGVYAHNAVDYVADSGFVDIDIPLDPIDANWLAMGGLPNKSGIPPYTDYLRYVSAPASEWGLNWTGNAYVCPTYLNPLPGTDMIAPLDAAQVKGRLLVQSLVFLQRS